VIRFLRQFDSGAIRLIIFDLDGTLIDSRLDLVHSVNAMLRHFERQELPDELIASYVGDGAPTLVRRALGEAASEPELRAALEYFLGYYRLHKLDHTVVYAGIPEVLAGLAGVQSESGGQECPPHTGFGGRERLPHTRRLMAVLTNKPVNPSRDIVSALGLGDFFVRVYGGNSFPTKKPDPLGVQTILQETGVIPGEAIMIGDSGIDVQTGRNAGVWTCGVTYGFAPHTLEEVSPDVVIDAPKDLLDLFP